MHLLASLVQLHTEGVGGERSAGTARLTHSPKQHLWLLLREVDPGLDMPLGSLTYVLKSTGNQYAWILEVEQTEICFPVIKSLILTLPSTLVSPCLDTYSALDISLVLWMNEHWELY